jgi:carboxyl-terminal processing protease
MLMNRRAADSLIMSAEDYGAVSDLLALNELLDKMQSEALDGAPEREALISGAMRGAVETLQDPYAQYYTAAEYEAYLSSINGAYYGVGMVIGQSDAVGSPVLEVYEGNPAEKAGVKAGDIIIKVDGAAAANLPLEELRAKIDAPDGGAITLTLLRGQETLEIAVQGGPVNIKHVKGSLYNERTGYIKIDMFTGNCVNEFTEALKDLKSRNMKSLVIDLRNNPGGSLDAVVAIADALLGNGQTIVSVGEQGNASNRVFKGKGSAWHIPLAVLVNENSASASEILAGAVQDNGIGAIVGMQTFGKGIVQTTMRVERNGGWLKLTTDAYFTPSGKNIHGVGITPDILVEMPEELIGTPLSKIDQADDAQLWAALDYVREQAQ